MSFRVLVPLAALLFAGCQPLPRYQTHFGFEPGGALTAREYARLGPLAQAQVTEIRSKLEPPPSAPKPQVTYVFSFRSDFNPATMTRIGVGPFAGKGPEEAKIASELPGELAAVLTKRGLPASVGSAEPLTISGTVTRAPAPDAAEMHAVVETQVEARVIQAGTTVGVLQVNSVALHTNITGGAPILLIGSLISRATQPSRVSVLGGTIADALLRVRGGEKEAAYSNRALPQAGTETATETGSKVPAPVTR